jgi:hypothetical protein
MQEQVFKCRICLPTEDESNIRHALEKALPSMRWHEGDSSWDKVRVWGEGPDATVRIYRYEGPGPFDLTVTLKTPEGTDAEQACLALRDRVVLALRGKVWKPLAPQPISLIKAQDRFPAAYEFECELEILHIKWFLEDADFWSWQAREEAPFGMVLEGRVPFRLGGKFNWRYKERLRVTGGKPSYRIEVGHWDDEAGRVPTCDQVHETVQNTILPAIGARSVRGVYSGDVG